jgi:hypothetical protein
LDEEERRPVEDLVEPGGEVGIENGADVEALVEPGERVGERPLDLPWRDRQELGLAPERRHGPAASQAVEELDRGPEVVDRRTEPIRRDDAGAEERCGGCDLVLATAGEELRRGLRGPRGRG